MTESNKGLKANERSKKFLWFGYGNYGAQPNLQIGGGYVRDPALFGPLSKKMERSPMTCLLYVASALIGLTVVVGLFAWVISLVLR